MTTRCSASARWVIVVLAVAIVALPALAQSSRRAPDQSGVTRLLCVVEQVNGRVFVRATADARWRPARVGMTVRDGAEFNTGVKSSVRVRIGANQAITIDRLGRVKLLQAINDGEAERSRLELEQGRVLFDVNSKQYKNDVQIRTPDATLAVVGTQGGVEYVVGFGTRAFGAEENTGVFLLKYDTGTTARVTLDEQTDAQDPQPAQRARRDRRIDTGAPRARSAAEEEQLNRTIGEGDLQTDTLIGIVPQTPMMPILQRPDSDKGDGGGGDGGGDGGGGGGDGGDDTPGIVFIDENGKTLERATIGGGASELGGVQGLGDAQVGLATRANPDDGKAQLLRIESTVDGNEVRNRFLEVPIDGNGAIKELVTISGTVDSLPAIDGAGAIGTRVFGVGQQGDKSMVYSLNLDQPQPSIGAAMDIGLDLDGAAAGASDRGSLFVAGFESGSLAVLEVDPRINHISTTFSASSGDFAGGGSGGLSVDSITEVTGMAYVDGVLVFAGRVPGSGGTVFFEYEPDAASDARVRRITQDEGARVLGLAPDGIAAATPSVELSSPSSAVDTSLGALFSEMSYAADALRTGVIDRIVSDRIVLNAKEPAACVSSGALSSLPELLSRHAGERRGIGRVVNDFRQSIPSDHPCQPPTGN